MAEPIPLRQRALRARQEAREERVENGGGGSDDGGMYPAAEIAALGGRVGKLETAVDWLRHTQTIGFGAVLGAIGLFGAAILGVTIYMLQDMSGQIRDMNGRFDRFLERQADMAAAANARFDRLLEQRATQPPPPIVIQLPPAPQSSQPATPQQ